jgi:hypothetical protein
VEYFYRGSTKQRRRLAPASALGNPLPSRGRSPAPEQIAQPHSARGAIHYSPSPDRLLPHGIRACQAGNGWRRATCAAVRQTFAPRSARAALPRSAVARPVVWCCCTHGGPWPGRWQALRPPDRVRLAAAGPGPAVPGHRVAGAGAGAAAAGRRGERPLRARAGPPAPRSPRTGRTWGALTPRAPRRRRPQIRQNIVWQPDSPPDVDSELPPAPPHAAARGAGRRQEPGCCWPQSAPPPRRPHQRPTPGALAPAPAPAPCSALPLQQRHHAAAGAPALLALQRHKPAGGPAGRQACAGGCRCSPGAAGQQGSRAAGQRGSGAAGQQGSRAAGQQGSRAAGQQGGLLPGHPVGASQPPSSALAAASSAMATGAAAGPGGRAVQRAPGSC